MAKSRREDPTLSLPAEAQILGSVRLVVAPGGPDERRVPIATALGRGPVVIGSAPEVDVVIDDPHVSGRHCELRVVPGGLQVSDLGSLNGTKVQGVAVQAALLEPGAVITLGTTHLLYERVTDEESAATRPGSTSGIGESSEIGLDGPSRFGGAIGSSTAMRRVFAVLHRLAPTDLTLTILGETGTGKDVLARAVHEASSRAGGPFVVFDCGAAAPTLIESQLFGHQRGAFTGAHDDHQGAFERANRGTLFLDEIGELSLDLQPKLLRVIEQRRVGRLGSQAERPVDVRVLCATNRDLEREVAEGRFRQDLFFRINMAVVRLPPLRERRDDLVALVNHFAGERELKVSSEAMAILTSYEWPGNVRELRNVILSAAAVSDGQFLRPRDFILFSGGSGAGAPGAGGRPRAPDLDGMQLAGRTLEQIESTAIRQTLQHCGGNKTKAARALGIAPSTLYAKLKKYLLAD
ncbi:MAG TPA: sigma 54-interacting transcriptional regulator [Kofleriaceae bacterium]|nr:sigma 54-interacting transcriptional regulator [Kofleriaceae bacterium]